MLRTQLAEAASSTTRGFCPIKDNGDCLPRRSDQWNWMSGSPCLGEEVEGVAEELFAGEQD